MDNSYVSVNVDVSPDIVKGLVVLSVVGALVYVTQRIVKHLERQSALQAA